MLTTVRTYVDQAQAHVDKGVLGSHEIPAFVIDQNHVMMDGLIQGALGGIKLQVPPEYAERADQVLSDLRIEDDEDQTEGIDPGTFDAPLDRPFFPKCRSQDVFEYRPLMWLYLLFPFLIFFGAIKKQYCTKCHHKWSVRK